MMSTYTGSNIAQVCDQYLNGLESIARSKSLGVKPDKQEVDRLYSLFEEAIKKGVGGNYDTGDYWERYHDVRKRIDGGVEAELARMKAEGLAKKRKEKRARTQPLSSRVQSGGVKPLYC